jgi:voltage-gated potassium channel
MDSVTMYPGIYRKFIWSGLALLLIVVIGIIGYWFLTERQHSFLDVLYMTVITITTIGFGEVIDLAGNPAARVFTIFIAVSGIGVLLYVVANFTALLVEGEVIKSFRRRKMAKMARNSEDHCIVCGVGRVGFYTVNELHATERPHVVVDSDRENINRVLEAFPDVVYLEGDATDDKILLKAGILKARGVFAVTGDDNQNLVISLTAKYLNPNVRIVARCNEIKNDDRMRKAGADAVVSPSLIGGLRMASELIRPAVVSFLEMMLRTDEEWRVEEIAIPIR